MTHKIGGTYRRREASFVSEPHCLLPLTATRGTELTGNQEHLVGAVGGHSHLHTPHGAKQGSRA
jgi:hypothetical protein